MEKPTLHVIEGDYEKFISEQSDQLLNELLNNKDEEAAAELIVNLGRKPTLKLVE